MPFNPCACCPGGGGGGTITSCANGVGTVGLIYTTSTINIPTNMRPTVNSITLVDLALLGTDLAAAGALVYSSTDPIAAQLVAGGQCDGFFWIGPARTIVANDSGLGVGNTIRIVIQICCGLNGNNSGYNPFVYAIGCDPTGATWLGSSVVNMLTFDFSITLTATTVSSTVWLGNGTPIVGASTSCGYGGFTIDWKAPAAAPTATLTY